MKKIFNIVLSIALFLVLYPANVVVADPEPTKYTITIQVNDSSLKNVLNQFIGEEVPVGIASVDGDVVSEACAGDEVTIAAYRATKEVGDVSVPYMPDTISINGGTATYLPSGLSSFYTPFEFTMPAENVTISLTYTDNYYFYTVITETDAALSQNTSLENTKKAYERERAILDAASDSKALYLVYAQSQSDYKLSTYTKVSAADTVNDQNTILDLLALTDTGAHVYMLNGVVSLGPTYTVKGASEDDDVDFTYLSRAIAYAKNNSRTTIEMGVYHQNAPVGNTVVDLSGLILDMNNTTFESDDNGSWTFKGTNAKIKNANFEYDWEGLNASTSYITIGDGVSLSTYSLEEGDIDFGLSLVKSDVDISNMSTNKIVVDAYSTLDIEDSSMYRYQEDVLVVSKVCNVKNTEIDGNVVAKDGASITLEDVNLDGTISVEGTGSVKVVSGLYKNDPSAYVDKQNSTIFPISADCYNYLVVKNTDLNTLNDQYSFESSLQGLDKDIVDYYLSDIAVQCLDFNTADSLKNAVSGAFLSEIQTTYTWDTTLYPSGSLFLKYEIHIKAIASDLDANQPYVTFEIKPYVNVYLNTGTANGLILLSNTPVAIDNDDLNGNDIRLCLTKAEMPFGYLVHKHADGSKTYYHSDDLTIDDEYLYFDVTDFSAFSVFGPEPYEGYTVVNTGVR